MYNIIKTTVTISMIRKIHFTMLFVHTTNKKEIMQARPHLFNQLFSQLRFWRSGL